MMTTIGDHKFKRYLLWVLVLFGSCAALSLTAWADGLDPNPAHRLRTFGPAVCARAGQDSQLTTGAISQGLGRHTVRDQADSSEAQGKPSRKAGVGRLAGSAPEVWETLSIYGGEMTSIAQDPFNTNTVYVGTRDAGVFKTTDGGNSWQPARQGLTFYPIRCLTADPVHPETLYAGTDYDGIWKTTDGAATWFRAGDNMDGSLIAFNIVLDPQNTNVLYAGMAGGVALTIGHIYKSVDGGLTWQVKETGIPRYQYSSQYINGIFSLVLDPSNPVTLYAGTGYGQGVFRTTDGGETWSAFSDGLPQDSSGKWEDVVALATDPSHDNRAAASCWWYGYYAYQAGTGWTHVAFDDHPFSVGPAHLYFHPTDPSILYFAGEGFMSSTDGGQHWSRPSDFYQTASLNGIAFHPSAANTLYGSIEPLFNQAGGVLKSIDQGKNWVDVSSGITAATIQSLAADPQDPRNLYACTGDNFFYYSRNSGQTWVRGKEGSDYEFCFGSVAVDPHQPSKIYVLSTHGLSLSTDRGQTFNVINDKIDGLNQVLFSSQPSGPIYLATSTAGVFKSTDDGTTWVQKNEGIPQSAGSPVVLCLAVDYQHPEIIWAGTQAGLVKTIDGGDHWQVVGFTGDDDVVRALAFHPTNPQVMYASAGTLLTGNIYKSIDGGQTWQVKATGYDIGSFVFDPRNPMWIYTAANWDGVLRSMDGGETWYPLGDGIFYPLVYDIAITNETQPLLLAGSYGSGLYGMRAPVPVMRYAFPCLSYKPGLTNEGFGFVNTGTDPAQVTFTAYDTAGTPVKTSGAITWPGGAQAAYQADGLLGLTAETDAWVLAESNQSTLRGFFLSEQYGSGLAGLDGAAVFTTTMTDGVLPTLKTTGAFTTELFVANPGAVPILVAFVGYDGTQAHDGGQRTIPVRGFLKLDAATLFSGAYFDGYLRVVADGGFVGSATIRYAQASLASVNFLPASSAAEKQYAAHVTRWPSLYYSELNLVNPSDQTVLAVIDTYYTVQGQAGINHGWKSVNIPPYQVITLKDKDLGLPDGKVSDGWVKVEGWGGDLLGCVTFGQPGENQYLSILPLQAETETELWFAQVANGNVGGVDYFTGLAVVNPNTSQVQAAIKVYASDGTQLGQATVQVAANGKYVNMLRQIPGLTNLPDQASGYIRVSATQPVVSFVLFGDTALNFLSAVPAQH